MELAQLVLLHPVNVNGYWYPVATEFNPELGVHLFIKDAFTPINKIYDEEILKSAYAEWYDFMERIGKQGEEPFIEFSREEEFVIPVAVEEKKKSKKDKEEVSKEEAIKE